MEKYVCSVCGYEYDPAQGDPDNGVAPAPPSTNCPKTGSAPSAALPNPSSILRNQRSAV